LIEAAPEERWQTPWFRLLFVQNVSGAGYSRDNMGTLVFEENPSQFWPMRTLFLLNSNIKANSKFLHKYSLQTDLCSIHLNAQVYYGSNVLVVVSSGRFLANDTFL
jgi:hypothetical protein